MYLIDTDTIQLINFSGKNIPPYAILSHTWDKHEITFQDIYGKAQKDHPAFKKGYSKILGTCKIAREDGLKYAWVDTCCIDKTSSAELSESINCMFRWYQEAAVCYALLSDVCSFDSDKPEELAKSRWFYRGWTLQELIAPTRLRFYSCSLGLGIWHYLFTRQERAPVISKITGIATSYLQDHDSSSDVQRLLRTASVAERMSWAAKRETTRTEDIAYCLLGVFDINMPLLYGEGEKAFFRLQEEIIRRQDDQSLLAWHYRRILQDDGISEWLLGARYNAEPGGVLASSPSNFEDCGRIIQCRAGSATPMFSTTNKGLHITLPMCEDHALLECCSKDDPTTMVVLRLKKLYDNVYIRAPGRQTGVADYRAWQQWEKRAITILTREDVPAEKEGGVCSLVVRSTRGEFGMVAMADSTAGETEMSTRTSIVVPMRSMMTTEIKIFERTHILPETSPIILTLTAWEFNEAGSAPEWRWESLEFLLVDCSSPDAASSRGRGRFTRGTRSFLALPGGNLLYADVGNPDVFGRTILTVDLYRTSSWSFKGILLRTTKWLVSRMPWWLSSILGIAFETSVRVGVGKLLLLFLAFKTLDPQSLILPKTLEAVWKILGGVGVRMPQSPPHAFLVGLLGSIPGILPLKEHDRFRNSMIKRKHWFYTSPLCELASWFYVFCCLHRQRAGSRTILASILPPLLHSLWALYQLLRQFWTFKPQYMDIKGRTRHRAPILPPGTIDFVVSSWILALLWY